MCLHSDSVDARNQNIKHISSREIVIMSHSVAVTAKYTKQKRIGGEQYYDRWEFGEVAKVYGDDSIWRSL